MRCGSAPSEGSREILSPSSAQEALSTDKAIWKITTCFTATSAFLLRTHVILGSVSSVQHDLISKSTNTLTPPHQRWGSGLFRGLLSPYHRQAAHSDYVSFY